LIYYSRLLTQECLKHCGFGNPVDELPRTTPLIRGLRSATHYICSTKAVDGVKGVESPETAKIIRDFMNYGIYLSNHAMYLTVLGLPDFLPESEKQRSMLKLAEVKPGLVKAGMTLVKLGYKVVSVFWRKEDVSDQRYHKRSCKGAF